MPMLETNLTNGELWQLAFKMPALLHSSAGQMTVPEKENSWGIELDDGRTVVGCDFAATAEQLNNFLTDQQQETVAPSSSSDN